MNLSPDKMFELVTPTEAEISLGAKKIYDLFNKEVRPDWLEYGVKEGWYEPQVVAINGVKEYVFWYHLDAQGGMIVNAAASITGSTGNLPILVAAIEQKAKDCRARYVSFNTARAGLCREIQKLGYEPHSITFQKLLV